MNLSEILASWKSVLGSIAAILVVVLQVIQLLTSIEIEHTLEHTAGVLEAKTESIESAADKLRVLINSNLDNSRANSASLKSLHDEIAKVLEVEGKK